MSNLSTRGFVDGANPLIGGFIASVGTGNTSTVARAIGPDLANRGVATPLSDPMLEVRDVDGNLVDSNDDYVPGSDSVIDVEVWRRPTHLNQPFASVSLRVIIRSLFLPKRAIPATALVELYDLYH